MTGAAAWTMIQLAIGLGVVLQFNLYTLAISFAAVPIVIAYPLMKRITGWPQLVLGTAFNWGAIVGYTAVTADLNGAVVLPLYLSGIAWTIVYDTIYAHQDADEDRALGLKSTAITFGEHSRTVMSAFAALSVAALAVSGYYAHMGVVFYTISVGGAAMHYCWQLYSVRLNDRASCMKTFVSNKWFGAIVIVGIVIDKLVQPTSQPHADESNVKRNSDDTFTKQESIWQTSAWQLIRQYVNL